MSEPKNLKILHLIPSADPRTGGPIEAIYQFAELFRRYHVDAEICSLDAPELEFVKSSIIKIYALGPSYGHYSYNVRLIKWLEDNAAKYHCIIVNGLWQYTGFASWLALSSTSTPYYVLIHGMLDPWSIRTYTLKKIKKWVYWHIIEKRVLRGAKKIIYTSDMERINAKIYLKNFKLQESVGMLGVADPPSNCNFLRAEFFNKYPSLKNKRIILFLGRIHKVKGCDLLIKSFSEVASRDEDLHLVIAGPDQVGWLPTLQALSHILGVQERITWTGMLRGDLKWGALYAAEVFCLPSHQENFGVVVVEALACGKPVLISNKVNIHREVEVDGAGFIADDTVDGTIKNLRRWLDLSPEQLELMSSLAKMSFKKNFHILKAARRHLEIYQVPISSVSDSDEKDK